MKLRIEIDMSNDAFGRNPHIEAQRIIRDALEKSMFAEACRWGDGWNLRDVNGNTCGSLKVTDNSQ